MVGDRLDESLYLAREAAKRDPTSHLMYVATGDEQARRGRLAGAEAACKKIDPCRGKLESEPRYKALLRKLNLPTG